MKKADGGALMRAIELGIVAKVKDLCAGGGVDIVVKHKGSSMTPLYYAVMRGNAEVVELVIGAGGNVKSTDEHGRSLLHHVRDARVAKKLLDAGLDVNARSRYNRTPLHTAATVGDVALVQLYIDRGADLDAASKDEKTPFAVADSLEIRALLKKHGAKGLSKTDGVALKPKSKAAKPADLDVDGGALGVDADGNVWVGGNSAIFCWDGQKLTSFEFEESFSVSEIAKGSADSKSRVYFSTNWGLVVKTGNEWRLYSKENSELHDSHVTDMTVDRKGRACLMGYGDEVEVDRPISVFDGKGFEVWTADNGFPKGTETTCIAFDAKNRLVLGTKAGVLFADGTKFKVPGFGILAEPKVLVADGDDIWVGASSGVHRVSSKGQASQSIKPPSNTNCVAVDGETVWIGMYYGGLVRARGGEQKHFKPDNSGLEEEDVEALALGKDGTLWIAAGSALFRCDGDVISKFGEKAKPAAPAKVEKPKAEKPKPKKKLTPLPKQPLVPRKKLPPHVVKAIEGAKLENLDREALFRLVRPAIGIMIGKAGAVPVGGSKLGGRPDFAPGQKWPTYRGERDRYLPFLFQINLADIAKYDIEGLLPKKGRLAFFCDTQPDEIGDSRVIFDDGAKKASRLEWPEDLVDRKDEDDFVAQLPEHPLEFYSTWTLPGAEYFGKHAELTDVDEDTISDDLETKLHAQDPKKSSTTRLLGWADTLQGEILASPKTIVLLQIDGEMGGPKKLEELFSYWGNGLAHFLIDQTALAAKKLEKADAELAYT
jgi:uncharacterized protein YwqG